MHDLKPGDQVPHFVVHGVDGGEVHYRDLWQRKQLLLICAGGSESPPTALSDADLMAPFDTAVVITRDAVLGLANPGVLVADRWGEIHHVASGIPDPADLLAWVRYLQQRCPECEGEAR